MCDIAAPLGGANQFLHGRVGKVEHGPISRVLGTLRSELLHLLRDLACHQSPPSTSSRPDLTTRVQSRVSSTPIPDQKRGARAGRPRPPVPWTTRGFIGSRPSRCNFLRASLRARRTASAFSGPSFPKVSRNACGASSRGRRLRVASSSSTPSGLGQRCCHGQKPARGVPL